MILLRFYRMHLHHGYHNPTIQCSSSLNQLFKSFQSTILLALAFQSTAGCIAIIFKIEFNKELNQPQFKNRVIFIWQTTRLEKACIHLQCESDFSNISFEEAKQFGLRD